MNSKKKAKKVLSFVETQLPIIIEYDGETEKKLCAVVGSADDEKLAIRAHNSISKHSVYSTRYACIVGAYNGKKVAIPLDYIVPIVEAKDIHKTVDDAERKVALDKLTARERKILNLEYL